MYSFITNPITKKKTSIFSKKGQEIIKKYTVAQGGSLRTLSKASQFHQLPDSVYFDARKQWHEDPNGRERMLELEKHSNTKISKLATLILGNYANLVEIEIQNLNQTKNSATSTSGVPEIYKEITRDKELLENIITKKTDVHEIVSSISPEYERMKKNRENYQTHFSLSPGDESTNLNTRRRIRWGDEYNVVCDDEFEEEESDDSDSEEWYTGDEFDKFEEESDGSESESEEWYTGNARLSHEALAPWKSNLRRGTTGNARPYKFEEESEGSESEEWHVGDEFGDTFKFEDKFEEESEDSDIDSD